MRRGLWYAAGAYVIWGLLPLYWHALDYIPAAELVAHRIVWSCVLLVAIIVWQRHVSGFVSAIRSWRILGIYAGASLLIGVNWFTYIWAVNAGFVVETSLGYFINPLISVLLGVFVLHERLRPAQWTAIVVAATGVTYLTVAYGSFPWVALLLACTFAVYGLVKKLAPLPSVDGLALETGVLVVPSMALLVVGGAAFGADDPFSLPVTIALVTGTGVATTVPLLLFSSASRRIPLLWIGVLQYIAPTIQFMLGVFVFHETMNLHRLLGFLAVWAALAIFAIEGWLNHRATVVSAEAE